MLLIARILALISFFWMASISSALAVERYALVIGNSAYTGSSPLKNPKNDAELIGKTLKNVGFKVTIVTDASQKKMRRAMLAFSRTLRNHPDSIGLFYYAGHGLQVNGINYMVPVTADIKDEDEVRFEGVDVNDFLTTMRSSNSRLNIIILDACRNNPYARSFRSATRGLAPVQAASGTLIAYSTAPGDVAFDGNGLNSPYTLALSRYIEKHGLRVETVFKRVLASVEDATERKQTPWITGAFRGEFYFKGKKTAKVNTQHKAENSTTVKNSPPAKSSSTDLEKLFWESIVNSTNPASFKAYLSAFPEGTFSLLAKIKMNELKKAPEKLVVASRSSENAETTKHPDRLSSGSDQKLQDKSYTALPSASKDELEADPETPKTVVYKAIFPTSSQQPLDRSKVAGLDCRKLWRARNEIYYRHGYCFKSELGIRFFGNSNCTSPNVRTTALESRNMRTIRTWEIRKRCRDNRLLDEAEGRGPAARPARPNFRPKNRFQRPRRKTTRKTVRPKKKVVRRTVRPKKKVVRKKVVRKKVRPKKRVVRKSTPRAKPKKAFQPGGRSPREQFLE